MEGCWKYKREKTVNSDFNQQSVQCLELNISYGGLEGYLMQVIFRVSGAMYFAIK